MANTPSRMLDLGTPLPAFSLPDTISGRLFSSTELALRPAVVAFVCNHCPFVLHIQEALAEFGRFCQKNRIGMVAISSNSVLSHPQDGPLQMASEAKRAGYVFPYLYDETQQVAKAFMAACTPDFYAFDTEAKLAYRGQFDDSRPGNSEPVTGNDLRAALSALLSGERPSELQKPSIGCNIKWKPGNQPAYAR